jgi:putative FmdB family regulatory protein
MPLYEYECKKCGREFTLTMTVIASVFVTTSRKS